GACSALAELCYCVVFLFFFSSRRRHTRSKRDWSSDVCSSDLSALFCKGASVVSPIRSSCDKNRLWISAMEISVTLMFRKPGVFHATSYEMSTASVERLPVQGQNASVRSEERRVGKESSGRWAQ